MDIRAIDPSPICQDNAFADAPTLPALPPRFFDAILTMVNAGKLSEGHEYRVPLPFGGGRTLTLSIGRPDAPGSANNGATAGGLGPRQLRRVTEYIHQNIADAISLSALASVAGLSPSYFSRAFKASVGRAPYAHVVRLRIERAMAMMIETDEPLSQIALACGLSDQSHLSRRFHSLVGTSPSRWRRAQRR